MVMLGLKKVHRVSRGRGFIWLKLNYLILLPADTLANYTCKETPKSSEPNVEFYNFKIWQDNETEELGSGYQKHYAHKKFTSGCGYTDGKIFEERFRGKIFAFTGFWDHCSEGQVLLFNERTKLLSIISKTSLKSFQNFKCIVEKNNKIAD